MKFIFIIIAIFMAPLITNAAEPTLIATWKAHSYTPLSYIGKPLPVGGTPIDATIILIDNNRAISLSDIEVRWYQEGSLVTHGKGRTTHSFTAPQTGQDTVSLRVNIPHYNGRVLDQFIDIPVTRPEVVIDRAALPTLKPLFYFFSITNPASLAVSWDESGGFVILKASNKNNPLEFARAQITKP